MSRTNKNNEGGSDDGFMTFRNSNAYKDYNRKKSTPFIGGAERARREARKRLYGNHTNNHNRYNSGQQQGTNIRKRKNNDSSNSYTHKADEYLPKSTPAMERFFGSLFQSNVTDFVRSNTHEDTRLRLLQDMCRRVDLPMPITKLPCTFRDKHHYYSTR